MSDVMKAIAMGYVDFKNLKKKKGVAKK